MPLGDKLKLISRNDRRLSQRIMLVILSWLFNGAILASLPYRKIYTSVSQWAVYLITTKRRTITIGNQEIGGFFVALRRQTVTGLIQRLLSDSTERHKPLY